MLKGKYSASRRLSLSPETVAEHVPTGTTVGTLSVFYPSGTYTYTITADPDSKFQIVGGDLRTAAAIDFETDTSHSVTVQADNGISPAFSRTFTITVTNVAPVLTAASGSSTAATTADISVTTQDEPTGTLYWVITQSSSQPSSAQIKAGQNHTGAAAVDSGSIAVSAEGAQPDSTSALTGAEAYYLHAIHTDAGGADSNIVTSSEWTQGEVPVVGNQEIFFGEKTLAGAGGVELVTTGGGATSLAITTDDATAGHWTVDNVSQPPRIVPTATFVSAGADASYTLGVTASNDIGDSTEATITVTCSSSDFENTYHVSSSAEYAAWAALEDSGSVAQCRHETATGFCYNHIAWKVDAALAHGTGYKRAVLGDFVWRSGHSVTEILPAWDGVRHGAMLDMGQTATQGFFDRTSFGGFGWAFGSGVRDAVPISMDDSQIHRLCMSYGLTTPTSGGASEMLKYATVGVTIPDASWDSFVDGGTFRPGYVDGDNVLRHWSDANTALLPDLALPGGASLPSTGRMAHVWLHNGPSTTLSDGMTSVGATIHPNQNMPPYPRDSSMVVSAYATAVCVDSADRDTYAKELIQVGIDHYGAHTVLPEHVFMGVGGFGNGWKFPIVFAGFLLEDVTLQDFNDLMPTKYGGDTVYSFGEDGMTYLGEDEHDASPRYLWGTDKANIGYSVPFFHNHDARDPDGVEEVEAPTGYSNYAPAIISGAAGGATGAYSGDGAGGGTQTQITLLGTPSLAAITTARKLYLFIGGLWVKFDISAINDTSDIITVSSAPASPINSGGSAVAWKIAYASAYRLCCTSHTWVGQRLALHHLGAGAQGVWGAHYDVFAGYVDRWVADNYHPSINNLYGDLTGSDFIEDMWATYPP
jgi:hypothetical protein